MCAQNTHSHAAAVLEYVRLHMLTYILSIVRECFRVRMFVTALQLEQTKNAFVVTDCGTNEKLNRSNAPKKFGFCSRITPYSGIEKL